MGVDRAMSWLGWVEAGVKVWNINCISKTKKKRKLFGPTNAR